MAFEITLIAENLLTKTPEETIKELYKDISNGLEFDFTLRELDPQSGGYLDKPVIMMSSDEAFRESEESA